MVIDYWGRIRGQLDKEAGVVLMDVDLGKLQATRNSFPVLEHGCPPGVLTNNHSG
ncbi:MAG: hypothetical protein R3E95_15735 [Thiolinea sp.]